MRKDGGKIFDGKCVFIIKFSSFIVEFYSSCICTLINSTINTDSNSKSVCSCTYIHIYMCIWMYLHRFGENESHEKKKKEKKNSLRFFLLMDLLAVWMFSLSSLVASKSNYGSVSHRHPENPKWRRLSEELRVRGPPQEECGYYIEGREKPCHTDSLFNRKFKYLKVVFPKN